MLTPTSFASSEIKNARGIRVITVESHNYWDDYTWDDDEETLCAPSYFIRGEPVPEPVPEPTPEPIARPASESIPAACPVETPDNEPEPCSDLRSFTSVPALELASRNPGLYRHQLDEQE